MPIIFRKTNMVNWHIRLQMTHIILTLQIQVQDTTLLPVVDFLLRFLGSRAIDLYRKRRIKCVKSVTTHNARNRVDSRRLLY